ncbi:MAG: lipocalin-like domain-containing protein [Alkalilacustris sp.]
MLQPALAAILALLAAGPAAGQGFAGMGADAPGFAMPQRGHVLEFPRDHGAHPDFRIEWWYLTANLEGPDGTPMGVQWTLFRFGLAPGAAEGWDSPQGWMAHAGVTTPDAHFAAERFARDGIGQAGVTLDPFEAWIDDWAMTSRAGEGEDALDALHLTARGADFAFDLRATAHGPLVLHGDGGYSVKSEGGQASHYYSQPFFILEGAVTLPDGPVPVTGLGWLDREWSSQFLEGDTSGWDWFAMHLHGGDKLMMARVRSEADPDGGFVFGSWIAPDGTAEAFGPGTALGPDGRSGGPRITPLATARVAGRDVPVHWRVELPARGLDVEVEAVNPDAWMDTAIAYWEGPVRISGSHPGVGYLEMTGY